MIDLIVFYLIITMLVILVVLVFVHIYLMLKIKEILLLFHIFCYMVFVNIFIYWLLKYHLYNSYPIKFLESWYQLLF